MTIQRRLLVANAALLPLMGWCRIMAAETALPEGAEPEKLLLSDFSGPKPYYIDGSSWRGFSDQVMGGISDAAFGQDTIGGKVCARMTGNVTRESNGGFIQMALYFGADDAELDASGYKGIELLVYGNNEDYNLHVRTADCGWYDESYRVTFFVEPKWQTVRIGWEQFQPNGISTPLDTSRINRVAILGWMREFRADIGLAEISLYG